MTQEELEDLKTVLSLPGFKLVLKELDDVVLNIKNGIHGCSLSNDPTMDGQKLLNARMKFEGAAATQLALTQRLKAYKEKG